MRGMSVHSGIAERGAESLIGIGALVIQGGVSSRPPT